MSHRRFLESAKGSKSKLLSLRPCLWFQLALIACALFACAGLADGSRSFEPLDAWSLQRCQIWNGDSNVFCPRIVKPAAIRPVVRVAPKEALKTEKGGTQERLKEQKGGTQERLKEQKGGTQERLKEQKGGTQERLKDIKKGGTQERLKEYCDLFPQYLPIFPLPRLVRTSLIVGLSLGEVRQCLRLF